MGKCEFCKMPCYLGCTTICRYPGGLHTGASFGLDFLFVYGDRGRGPEVWNRHTGTSVNVYTRPDQAYSACIKHNGLSRNAGFDYDGVA